MTTTEEPRVRRDPQDDGLSARLLQTRRGRVSILYVPRAVVVSGLLLVATFALVVVALGLGDYPIAPADVLRTFAGRGTRIQDFVVYDLRLPRTLTAVLVGAALGLAGGVFQSLTRNALGSPDIIGFTEGASMGAVVAMLVLHGGQGSITVGALAGGFAVAVLVYVLSYRHGVQSYRLILVGIGISAFLSAMTALLLLRANILEAMKAMVWLTGSLNDRTWEQVQGVGLALLVLVPATLVFARRLSILEMGDDLASALGIPVENTRRWLLLLGTALTAVAVAAAGPIAFIALAAPQVARRLCGGATIGLIPAAVMGALMLVISDLVAQWAMYPLQLPVGVATLVVGGGYLALLLFIENRAGRE